MRGAIYSRVSTEIQDYGKQTDELKDYAARNNIEVKSVSYTHLTLPTIYSV